MTAIGTFRFPVHAPPLDLGIRKEDYLDLGVSPAVLKDPAGVGFIEICQAVRRGESFVDLRGQYPTLHLEAVVACLEHGVSLGVF